jgi:hypothetical protein
VGPRECSNEPLNSIKGGEFVEEGLCSMESVRRSVRENWE